MKRFLLTLILNVGFYTLFLVGSLVLIPTLTFVMILQAPFISHRLAMRRFRNLIKFYGRVVVKFSYPWVKINYEDCSVGGHTPCIYILNHRSTMDTFLVSFLPGEVVQVVNTWPFRFPVLGRLARCAGYLSIHEMSVETFYEKGGKLLSEGASLVVFPEGTRSQTRVMGSFHSTAFRLALRCGVPLVPVCLSGAEMVIKKGSLKLSHGEVKIHLMESMKPEEFQGMNSFKLKTRVQEIMAEELIQMEVCA